MKLNNNLKAVVFLIPLIAIALFTVKKPIFSQTINSSNSSIDRVEFTGEIIGSKDISAIGFVGKYLLIGSDEGNTIQVLEPNRQKTQYQVVRNIELPIIKTVKAEVDIEGIAISGNTVYVVGSHSSNKKVEPNKKDNRKSIFRFNLNPETGELASEIARSSLQKILEQDEVMSQFANIEHQKNGVNIEGIAIKNNLLYFGFRTPVLQDSYVPIIATDFQHMERNDKYELYHVNLDGNGIRDLVAVEDGFLILADETGTDGNDYRVYFWSGNDISTENTVPAINFLSEIPAKKKTRAEGLTILEETDSSYKVLVVYDGVERGKPTIFKINKP